MIEMPCDVREDDIYVPLGYLCVQIIESADDFLKHMEICGDISNNSMEAELLRAGFRMAVGGIVSSLTTYGKAKDDMARLNTVEDFLKIVEEK